MATAMAVVTKLPFSPSFNRQIHKNFIREKPQLSFNVGVKPIKCQSNNEKSGVPIKIVGNGYRFLQLGPHKSRSTRTILANSLGSSSKDGVTATISQTVSISFLFSHS